jgi:hypothetical protein
MQVVNQRPGWAASFAAASGAIRGQQRPPTRLDHPIDHPIGMSLAQSRHCRKGVQNVAHGAEPGYQQAKVGVCPQT